MTVTMFFIVLFEELLFRGILFQELLDRFGEPPSIILSSLAFCLVHLNNPHISFLGLTNIFLGGLVLSYIFARTKSLILCIEFHFLWNVIQPLITGSQVSGYDAGTGIFYLNRDGINSLLSGGLFGAESSIIITLALILILIIIHKILLTSPYISSRLYTREYQTDHIIHTKNY